VEDVSNLTNVNTLYIEGSRVKVRDITMLGNVPFIDIRPMKLFV
jgi:tRNA (Thr-GGU) A37 N-methylase